MTTLMKMRCYDIIALPWHPCIGRCIVFDASQAFREAVYRRRWPSVVRLKALFGRRPRPPLPSKPPPRTATAYCKFIVPLHFLLTCGNLVLFRAFFCVVLLLRTKQSSKNGNKPKKSVGKSLLKKPFPSVAQAIRKQVRALSSSLSPYTSLFFHLPVSTHLARPLCTFESAGLLPLNGYVGRFW